MEAVLEQIDAAPASPAEEPAFAFDDPLLSCLVILSRIYGVPKSASALAAGLPVGAQGVTPDLFVRAAERIGLSANAMLRPYHAISSLQLPCVLLLNDGQACVLLRFVDSKLAEVAMPENLDGVHHVPLKELYSRYSGRILTVRPKIKMDVRSSDLSSPRPHSWFWGRVFDFTPIYLEVMLAAVLVNVFAVATPIFTMIVYDRIVPNRAFDTLIGLSIGIAIILSFDFLLRTMRGYFLDRVGKNLDRRISASIFEQILSMKMAAGPSSSGAFASNIREFETLRDFFTSASLTAVVDLPFLFVFLIVMFLLGGPVVLVPGLLIPLVIVVSCLVQVPMRQAVERSYRENAQKHATLVETINGLEAIKAASAEGRRQREWDGYVSAAAASAMSSRFWSTIAINFTMMASSAATIGVIIWGVYRTANGDMTTGAMVAVSMLTGRAMAPLGQIAGFIVRFHQSWTSLRGLNRLMALPVERPVGQTFLSRQKFDGDIEFRGVSFKYPGQQGSALESISFKIKPGDKVGIIGRIGSGKTTIERLLIGLYDAGEGAVLVDGTDIRQIDPADLRRNIGCVLQDGNVFYGSVKDNITLGAPYVDEAAIFRAAAISGVDSFTRNHPLGFDLQVGEGGRMLSGGQRQSILIARAVVMDPPIIVMDEPTSSMDNSTEAAFKARLTDVINGKTFVLVTHRHSMLSLVDRLIVIDGGKVVADGPKQAVLDALVKGRVQAVRP